MTDRKDSDLFAESYRTAMARAGGESANFTKELRSLNDTALKQQTRRIRQSVTSAEDMLKSEVEWMQDFVRMKESSPEKLEDYSACLIAFGSHLKGATPELRADELERVLIKGESDLVEAMAIVDHKSFCADMYDAAHHDISMLRQIAAMSYTTMRDLFGSMSLEHAMSRLDFYKSAMTQLRSFLYIGSCMTECVEYLHKRVKVVQDENDALQATVHTLRRQLKDFHNDEGTVGRDMEHGGYTAPPEDWVHTKLRSPPQGAGGLDASMNSFSTTTTTSKQDKDTFVVILQLEDLAFYRARSKNVFDAALEAGKETILGLAASFDVTRTNYEDEKEIKGMAGYTLPQTYMFEAANVQNALGFAMEVQVEFTKTKWPGPIMAANEFSTMPWKGVTVRCGIHCGPVSVMDLPEASRVTHYEGKTIDKLLRLVGQGVPGDTLVSATAWTAYDAALKSLAIPPSKRFEHARKNKHLSIENPKLRGFKRGEVIWKAWPIPLVARMDNPKHATFPPLTFYKLQEGDEAAASSNHVTEELETAFGEAAAEVVVAKDRIEDMEQTIGALQQELDSVNLLLLKRDTDVEEAQNRLIISVSNHEQKMHNKMDNLYEQIRVLECDLMASHDDPAHVAQDKDKAMQLVVPQEFVPGPAGGRKKSVMLVEAMAWRQELKVHHDRTAQRALARLSIAGAAQEEEEDGGAYGRTYSGISAASGQSGQTAQPQRPQHRAVRISAQMSRHRNQKLWKDLNEMVRVTKEGMDKTQHRMQKFKKAGASEGSSAEPDASPMFTLHHRFRVFTSLLKRFTIEHALGDTEENASSDLNDQRLNEEQFVKLFMKLVSVDSQAVTSREAMQELLPSAIETDDVERANKLDDARLSRSVQAHMAKMIALVSKFKRRAVVEYHQLQVQHAAEAAAMAAPTRKKKTSADGGGKGSGNGLGERRASRYMPPQASARGNTKSTNLTPVTGNLESAGGASARRASLTAGGPKRSIKDLAEEKKRRIASGGKRGLPTVESATHSGANSPGQASIASSNASGQAVPYQPSFELGNEALGTLPTLHSVEFHDDATPRSQVSAFADSRHVSNVSANNAVRSPPSLMHGSTSTPPASQPLTPGGSAQHPSMSSLGSATPATTTPANAQPLTPLHQRDKAVDMPGQGPIGDGTIDAPSAFTERRHTAVPPLVADGGPMAPDPDLPVPGLNVDSPQLEPRRGSPAFDANATGVFVGDNGLASDQSFGHFAPAADDTDGKGMVISIVKSSSTVARGRSPSPPMRPGEGPLPGVVTPTERSPSNPALSVHPSTTSLKDLLHKASFTSNHSVSSNGRLSTATAAATRMLEGLGMSPTEVQEFSIEQRNAMLKEKWAKQKQDRVEKKSGSRRSSSVLDSGSFPEGSLSLSGSLSPSLRPSAARPISPMIRTTSSREAPSRPTSGLPSLSVAPVAISSTVKDLLRGPTQQRIPPTGPVKSPHEVDIKPPRTFLTGKAMIQNTRKALEKGQADPTGSSESLAHAQGQAYANNAFLNSFMKNLGTTGGPLSATALAPPKPGTPQPQKKPVPHTLNLTTPPPGLGGGSGFGISGKHVGPQGGAKPGTGTPAPGPNALRGGRVLHSRSGKR